MILAFDATAAECAVALFVDGTLVAERREPMTRGHAERLFPLIEECLAEAGETLGSLSAIAVCTGPGNFTGARIGVAAARGLALSTGAKAIGVDRFEIAAEGWSELICVRLEGRGGGAHLALFHNGELIKPAETVQEVDQADYVGDAKIVDADRIDLMALASIAERRMADDASPRPAPRYLKPANAALPREAPPQIL